MKLKPEEEDTLFTGMCEVRISLLRKKIQAGTEFEPITSTIPMHCSTNEAIDPILVAGRIVSS